MTEVPQSPVRFIWFDQDDTLYDYHRAMRRSLAAALRLIHDRFPHTRDCLAVDDLARARRDVQDHCDRAGMGPSQARREGFHEALVRHARPDAVLADALTNCYYKNLGTDIHPFPDSIACLNQLHGDYVLGVLSNGMSLLPALGLGRFFGHQLYADELGMCKPDLPIFEHAMGLAGARAEECLLVGDDVISDVMGARDAGWHAVWLNRPGKPWPLGAPPPELAISSLAELPPLVANLNGVPAA
ncbi:MAG: HAD family hydrolase [Armatimonadota bacterium]